MSERPREMERRVSGSRAIPKSLEDAKLIARIQAGQSEAFGDLVRKYQDRIFNTCWRICGHLEDARDLTQEAFLKAYEGLNSFRHQSGFYTWIYRVAVNLAISHRRNESRRASISLDAGSDVQGTQAASLANRVASKAEDSPESSASDRELQGHLVRALQELEVDYRAVIILRDIEGLNYHEICEILQIPRGTVKSRLFRARATLSEVVIRQTSGTH